MALRVLHVGKFFPPYVGGMESYLQALIHAQRADGVEAFALVHGSPMDEDPPWLRRVATYGQLLYAPVAPGFRRALRKAVQDFSPDILHIHMPNTSAFWALTLASSRRIPWVIHWQSDVVTSRIRRTLAFAYQAYRPFEQAMLERAHTVVATSPPYLEASSALAAWRHKCVMIPLGMEPLAALSGACGVQGYWREGSFRLLSIGRLTYYKGFETLIRAVARVPKAELLIAGDGELRARLEVLIQEVTPANEAPRTRLLGKVSETEKNELLASCELFCLASRERTESFGMVLLEAMQYGCPCLVSDLPGSGVPWVVRQVNCGLAVEVENVSDWAHCIERLSASPDLLAQMAENAKIGLSAHFDIRKSALLLKQTYLAINPGLLTCELHERPLIVIPAKNESATISAIVQNLAQAGFPDVVVINDQSTDNTAALASAAGAIVLNPPLPLGAWGAMQTGIRYALREGYASVITMDADGQHCVSDVARLIDKGWEADVVIGACPSRGSPARRFAWAWFRKLTGFGLEDLTSGFRYYNRKALRLLASDEATLLDYQDLGVLILLRRCGMRIVEVPVSMNLRNEGKSRIFHSWLAVVRYMAETSFLCLARWGHNQTREKK